MRVDRSEGDVRVERSEGDVTVEGSEGDANNYCSVAQPASRRLSAESPQLLVHDINGPSKSSNLKTSFN